MMRRTLMPLAMLATAACVTQGTYDDLKKQYDDAQRTLTERQTKITDLEQALANEQTKVQELNAAIEEAKSQIAALTEERERLTAEEARLGEELAQLIKDRSRLKESTDKLKVALRELQRRKAEADRRVAQFRSLLAKFKDLIDAGKLKVKIIDGRMVLALPSDVLFGSGSAKLSKEGSTAVAQVAAVLAGIKNRRFQVEGHTDNVPISNARFPSNWELSAARALGVVKAMVEAGMVGEVLSAAGYGEFHPVASNDTEEGRAENRRIEIVLVPDLSSLPGFEELKQVVGK